jgi:site-specific DNA recombinase
VGFWGYDQKVQLQNLLFPEGVLYDRGNDNYRTTKINLILELTQSFSNPSYENKKGQTKNKFDLPAWVARRGVEPLLPE